MGHGARIISLPATAVAAATIPLYHLGPRVPYVGGMFHYITVFPTRIPFLLLAAWRHNADMQTTYAVDELLDTTVY